MKRILVFFILILSHLSSNAEGIKLSCEVLKPSCTNCPEYKTLFPISDFSTDSESLNIEADESEIKNNSYILSGNVEVKSETLILIADDVKVNPSDDSTIAKGNVQFQDKAYLVTSNEVTAKKSGDSFSATAKNAKYQDYKSGTGGANGFTEFITKTPTSVLLTNSTYSLCPISSNDWYIDADKINIDLGKNRGSAENATLVFLGVPVFYSPKYSWVLSGRGSGFLAPDINRYKEAGKDKNEFGVRVPYYLNLAPDKDLLLALNYMSSRSFIYEGKYRKLIAPKISPDHDDSIWTIQTKYLPKDKITGLKRWLLNFTEELDISDKLHLSAEFYRVSDTEYFKDIDRTNTDLTRLNSFIRLNYDDPIENKLNLEIFSENEQLVNNGSAEYTKAIEVSLSKLSNIAKRTPIKIDLTSTNYDHDNATKETGIRSHGDFKVFRELNTKFPIITPNISAKLTNYSLDKSSNINRTILGTGVEVDFTTSKNKIIFGKEVKHRISPIISYNYRQKKAQASIPIFDTTDKYDNIITFEELVSGERYAGFDRISNANDITISLESSHREFKGFYDDKKEDVLNMRIAQSYFGDKEIVSNTNNLNYEKRKSYSDIAASVDLVLTNYILSNDVQYSPSDSKIIKYENSLTYKLSPRKFISLSYIDEGIKETRRISGSYPLTNKIHIFGGLDKTTSSGITNSETTGIAYESCCWAFRLAHFKEGFLDGSHSYTTGMELVFNGLGSTSTALHGRIENTIPEYISHIDLQSLSNTTKSSEHDYIPN
jgi:LPS-assembly protein